jgi:hypothetical protein
VHRSLALPNDTVFCKITGLVHAKCAFDLESCGEQNSREEGGTDSNCAQATVHPRDSHVTGLIKPWQ